MPTFESVRKYMPPTFPKDKELKIKWSLVCTGYQPQLASAATQMAAITETTSTGAKTQHEQTDQVASAITQMGSTVQEVAQQCWRSSQCSAACRH